MNTQLTTKGHDLCSNHERSGELKNVKAFPPYGKNAALNTCQLCRGTDSNNPWTRHARSEHSRLPHQVGLIAYLRSDGQYLDSDQQLARLQEYCKQHGYYILQIFCDEGKPCLGLKAALEALNRADGLIAINLDRFVEHPFDRLRDLRPFIRHFICETNKHLITVEEGIDTSFPDGQMAAVEMTNQLKEAI